VLAATVLALTSAVLHAAWNLILKTAPSQDRDLTSWGLFAVGGTLVLPVIVVMGGPGMAAAPWLAMSAVVHVAYVTFLVAAYRHGDFSVAYPLARGAGALVATIGGVALLGDRLPVGAWVAVAVVVAGLCSLVGPTVAPVAVRDALVTGVAIGTYTLLDAHGARDSANGLVYGLSSTAAAAVMISVAFGLRGRGGALVAAWPTQWRRWTVAGASTALAYGLVMVAVRLAPVGYVAMLRESSVVLGVLAGWLWLKESMGARRLASAGVILTGLAGLVWLGG